MVQNSTSNKTIAFVSTCHIDWGGSEELWGQAAKILLTEGYTLFLFKEKVNRSHPRIKELIDAGLIVIDFKSATTKIDKLKKQTSKILIQITGNPSLIKLYPHRPELAFANVIKRLNPSLTIISQGINFDGLNYALQCMKTDLPYVILSQKAVDFFWPTAHERKYMVDVLKNADKCFFVSKHNQRITQEQFSIELEKSEVVFNPVKIPELLPYPKTEPYFKLACVARLFLLDKGQDILLRILAKEKWKSRPIKVTFVGNGEDFEGLRDLASFLNVENIEFAGQVSDMENVWREHHALILPSRSEGLPLSLVEAMAAGRPVITTNAGGNAELLNEGETGFVGTIDQQTFEQAMERAWEARSSWENMGKRAAEYVRSIVPKQPEKEFSKRIIELLNVNK